MRERNELVEAYEAQRRWAEDVGTWKLQWALNWGRWRLQRTGSELRRIRNLAMETELNHRPQYISGERRAVRP